MGVPHWTDSKVFAREKALSRLDPRPKSKTPRNLTRVDRQHLTNLYRRDGRSVREIAALLGCSPHKVSFWISRYRVGARTVGNAMYAKRNPGGDPFRPMPAMTRQDSFLAGLGLGLFWKGAITSGTSVRFGSSEPRAVRAFVVFLKRRYGVPNQRLRFTLRIPKHAFKIKEVKFWCRTLDAKSAQFQRVSFASPGGRGTRQQEHGVLTVYFHNIKLRDILRRELERVSY